MADKEELAELARLNAFAKGYRSTFVLIRNRLTQALPLYRDGPTLSPQRTIDDGLNKLGPAADKVHKSYQRLIKLDADKRHQTNYEEHQDITGTEYNNLSARADFTRAHERATSTAATAAAGAGGHRRSNPRSNAGGKRSSRTKEN
jgi:hypothetical protein